MERWIAVTAFLLLAYTWVGYPVLLWVLRQFFARKIARAPQQNAPKISIIIAVRNEEDNIAARLIDCTNLEYPADRLEIVIVSDNSTDKIEEMVKEFAERDPRIRCITGELRQPSAKRRVVVAGELERLREGLAAARRQQGVGQARRTDALPDRAREQRRRQRSVPVRPQQPQVPPAGQQNCQGEPGEYGQGLV